MIGATSPAVDARMVVAGFNSSEIVALNSINGRVAWSDSLTIRTTRLHPCRANAIVGRPVIDGDRVFAVSPGAHGQLICVPVNVFGRRYRLD